MTKVSTRPLQYTASTPALLSIPPLHQPSTLSLQCLQSLHSESTLSLQSLQSIQFPSRAPPASPQGYVSNLRSRRALPNDYWTAETVEDYMRCKVAPGLVWFGLVWWTLLSSLTHNSGYQLPNWGPQRGHEEGRLPHMDHLQKACG